MRETNLTTAVSALITEVQRAAKSATIAQEIRYDLPSGYTAPQDRDGVSRPIEALVIAHEDRGVLPEVTNAVHALNRARADVAHAVASMDAAVSRWESAPQ